jgi:hypothetical protein
LTPSHTRVYLLDHRNAGNSLSRAATVFRLKAQTAWRIAGISRGSNGSSSGKEHLVAVQFAAAICPTVHLGMPTISSLLNIPA